MVPVSLKEFEALHMRAPQKERKPVRNLVAMGMCCVCVAVKQALAALPVLCSHGKDGELIYFLCVMVVSSSCRENILISSLVCLPGSAF